MSIIIHNFTLAYDQWMPITDLAVLSVDVIDSAYPIVVSGTRLYYNDTLVSGTFTSITDGYRITYNPGTISGGVAVMVHAENTNGEVKEETYNMLFGYHVEYNEPVTWGPHTQIDIWMKARNLALCPNEETEAFYFRTLDYPATNLIAKIYPVEPQDLGATLRTQSTFFYYGQTYTVTVENIRDYHGNTMEPYIFSFTIEDPTGD